MEHYKLTPSGLEISRHSYDRLSDERKTDVILVPPENLHEYLSLSPKFEGLTLRDVFNFLAKNKTLQSIFKTHWVESYLEEFKALQNKLPVTDAPEISSDSEDLTYSNYPIISLCIQASNPQLSAKKVESSAKKKYSRKPSPDMTIDLGNPSWSWTLDKPYAHASGRSAVVIEDIISESGFVLHKAGSPIDFSISFTPLEELLDLPIVIDNLESNLIVSTPSGTFVSKVYVPIYLSMWSFFDALLNEISFHGPAAEKEDRYEDLSAMAKLLPKETDSDSELGPEIMLYSSEFLYERFETSLAGKKYALDLIEQLGDPYKWITGYQAIDLLMCSVEEFELLETKGFVYSVHLKGQSKSFHRYPTWQFKIKNKDLFRRIHLRSGALSNLQFHQFCEAPFGAEAPEYLRGLSLIDFLNSESLNVVLAEDDPLFRHYLSDILDLLKSKYDLNSEFRKARKTKRARDV